MGFLCRQGRIKMEVVVGLLIVIGTMLEGTEGFKCYAESSGGKKTEVTCGAEDANTCLKVVEGGEVSRACANRSFPKEFRDCYKKAFGKKCPTNSAADTEKFNVCYKKARTNGEDGPQTRQAEDHACMCFTNLCNPAGRSTPNAQVILGVLVAASLYALNTGLGSL